MEEGAAGPESRWSTAVALAVAVLFLSVLNAVTLVLIPLAVLLGALPATSRWKQVALGALLMLLAVALSDGPLGALARAWALLLAGAYLFATLTRPGWGVLARGLGAVGASFAVAALGLGVSGEWAAIDAMVREHFATMSSLALDAFGARVEDPELAAQWRAATERVSELQWKIFPAVLALESLAALALASWCASRIRGGDPALRLGRLRDFRFDDPLVWVLIAGLVLVLAPAGAALARVGYNALVFMAGLYALRGLGVFWSLAGTPSLLAIGFAVLLTIFLYPLVLTATVLVGLGDTWLDVRGRAAPAPPG